MQNIPQNAEEINRLMYHYDNVHQPVPSMDAITEAHVKQYREQGFVAVGQVLNKEQVDGSVAAIMETIFDRETKVNVQFTKPQDDLKTDEERELAVRKVFDFVDFHEELHAIAYHPDIISFVERLLGEEAKLAQNQALLKPPYGGAEKPWHQDMAYGNVAYDKAVVGVWIALDEAALDNGCMHVIPRSHMDGGVPHYSVRDWQICDTNVPVEKDTAIPLQPGGALFFHGLLYHGTPNNFSDQRRRSLQFHYVPKSAQKLTHAEYKRMFTNEMTSAEC
ncbi:phytanoyl-CoA dioxygenase family protein [Paenibacillus spongiae]|uniref:Phytanoyl-CoA dioxygenase family protein n=1 Tax=Paenibacillus spongiae TaxID=2909671 RepID=A0ABY5SDE0_9BACL|nr:phytanoyl-CoA dioxygenase family protein [Paenibacillus spongiae]UVI31974.1 phytanoyl-CoA dioxygenase family protein [Paenibacillus spongiae]